MEKLRAVAEDIPRVGVTVVVVDYRGVPLGPVKQNLPVFRKRLFANRRRRFQTKN